MRTPPWCWRRASNPRRSGRRRSRRNQRRHPRIAPAMPPTSAARPSVPSIPAASLPMAGDGDVARHGTAHMRTIGTAGAFVTMSGMASATGCPLPALPPRLTLHDSPCQLPLPLALHPLPALLCPAPTLPTRSVALLHPLLLDLIPDPFLTDYDSPFIPCLSHPSPGRPACRAHCHLAAELGRTTPAGGAVDGSHQRSHAPAARGAVRETSPR